MKAIILAGKGAKQLPRKARFQTSLGWIVNSFEKANIKDINIVGGNKIENLALKSKNVKIIFNSEWERTGPLESLLMYKDILLKSDVIISFGDVVYNSSFITNFVKNLDKSMINILTDETWKTRFNRDKRSIAKAEKIVVGDNGNVICASRDLHSSSAISGEYTGVCFINKESSKEVISSINYLLKSKKSKGKYPIGFMDLFSEILKTNIKIKNHFSGGNWAELDNIKDFYSFTFGSKSQTLKNLKGSIKKAKVLSQFSFTVKDWEDKQQILLSDISNYFRSPKLVVRSSSLSEDSITSSMAGKFESVLDVDKNNRVAVIQSVNKVIDSFGSSTSQEDIIFIQPHLDNVKISGVAFSCDISTGAPYICVNFTESNDTDLVTSGSEANYNLFYSLKGSPHEIRNLEMNQLVTCIGEIENLMANPMLDIEFAFNKKGQLFIFQVRPIASQDAINNYEKFNITDHIIDAEEILSSKFKGKKSIGGKTTIFGKMPDWNPAELIGARPKPLASSLFHYLITKDIWRKARAEIGYFNPKGEELLSIILGQPFIDVRNSLNSLTPNSMPYRIRDKVVSEALTFLMKNPELHDKLEFEVATTCLAPNFDDRVSRWLDSGITQNEIEEIRISLHSHTNKLLNHGSKNLKSYIDRSDKLDKGRESLLTNASIPDLEKIRIMMQDCATHGTFYFSILARYAFIGNTFLKSFASRNIISPESYDNFLNSIDTVATELVTDLDKYKIGDLSDDAFLSKFGHLRPGTFDIESLRYDENLHNYFKMDENNITISSSAKNFKFSDYERANIESELARLELEIDFDSFLFFIINSIKGREYSKFIFTKSISDSLNIIKKWGNTNGFSPEDLSFIDFNILTNQFNTQDSNFNLDLLSTIIDNEKLKYNQFSGILLPDLITDTKDLFDFFVPTIRPNFITNKMVSAEKINLNSKGSFSSLSNKIIFIESADPGYDWIFAHKIAGLVTKYGGAASHMAIRCAEFGIPAAIGSGQLFDKLKRKKYIKIDCINKVIDSP